jgi:hypothetical protein
VRKSEGAAADAEAIARTHPAVAALGRRRHRMLFARPRPAHRGEAEGDGQLVVGFFDYDENRSIVALVDPRAGTVTSVEHLPAAFQLSEEEQREAETLAAEDARVQARLRGRSMNPLTRLFFPPDAAGRPREHRHAIVFLRPTPRERYYAVVDLSADAVVEVLTRRDLTGR